MATVLGPLTAEQRRALAFAPRTLARRAPPVVCYEPEGEAFVYPAFAAPPGVPTAARPEPGAFPPFRGELRAEQRVVVDELERRLRERRAALCELPTGAGKTVVALAVAARLAVPTLVVVHTGVLLEQWRERCRAFLAEAAVVRGAGAAPACALTVAMLQTLRVRTPGVAYGLVVYDEAHHMCARAFSRVMLRVRPWYALGLSATVARADGLETVLRAFLGDPLRGPARTAVRCAVEPLPLDDFGVVAHTAHVHALGRSCVNVARLVSDLAACEPRTRALVERCAALCAEGRRVLVVTQRRAHCVAFAEQLRARGVDATALLGGDKPRALAAHAAVVGTVGVVGEGFDAPWLDTLLFATPQVAVVQVVGRILRRANERPALVVDPIDALPSCKAQWRRRRVQYLAHGHEVL